MIIIYSINKSYEFENNIFIFVKKMLKKDKKIVIIYNVVHIIYYIFYKLKIATVNTITSHFLNVVIGDIICIAFFFCI